MRVLEPDIIIKAFILLSILFALLAVNIFFSIRKKINKPAGLFHVASFFGFAGIFCYLMDLVILDLPFESYYRKTGTISIIACLLLATIPIFALLFMKDKVSPHFHWSHDLKTVYSSIDDLAIIVDYMGIITEINHPDILEALLGDNCKTIDELIEKLRQKTQNTSLKNLEPGLFKMGGKEKFEINFCENNKTYILTGSPVVSGNSRLGTTIVMHDITEKKNSEQQIKNRIEYLEEANLKLSKYVKIANILEMEKERLKLMEQVQIELISNIEKAIDHVHSIQKKSYVEIFDYQNDIRHVADKLRDVYKDVRNSIRRISSEEGR